MHVKQGHLSLLSLVNEHSKKVWMLNVVLCARSMSFSTRLWWATTSTRSLFTLLRTRSLLSSPLMMLWSSSSLVAILSRRESFKRGIERAAMDRWVLLFFVYFGDVVWIVVLFSWFDTNLIIRRVLRDRRIIDRLEWWQEEKGGIKTIH